MEKFELYMGYLVHEYTSQAHVGVSTMVMDQFEFDLFCSFSLVLCIWLTSLILLFCSKSF